MDGTQEWGRAYRRRFIPRPSEAAWLLILVSERETFCRNCEHTIPAGVPFACGHLGNYCRTCLQRQGWILLRGFGAVEMD